MAKENIGGCRLHVVVVAKENMVAVGHNNKQPYHIILLLGSIYPSSLCGLRCAVVVTPPPQAVFRGNLIWRACHNDE